MAISIFHCWACEKHLDAGRKPEDYFFWCDKTCHDTYEKNVKKSGQKPRQWSNYMCGEGPCPEDMEPVSQDLHSLPKATNKKRGPSASGKKKAARAVKRIRQLSDASNDKKRTYTCGICGEKGHNARRCEKVKL